MNAQLPPPLVKEARSAGAEQALRDMGILPPLSQEKTAQLGWLGRGIVSLGSRLLSGKPGQAAGKGLLSRLGGVLSWSSNVAGKPIGSIGRGILQKGQELGWSPARLQFLQRFGRGLPAHMGGFGLFGGVTSAATAQPGEDRFKAFLKGFGGGALAGGVMGGVGNLYRMGLTKMAPGLARTAAGVTGKGSVLTRPLSPTGPLTNIRSAGTNWRQLGAKAALGGGAFMAGDIALAPFDMSLTKGIYDIAKGQPQERPLYAYPQIYTAPAVALGQRYGAGSMLGVAPGYGAGMFSPWQQGMGQQ